MWRRGCGGIGPEQDMRVGIAHQQVYFPAAAPGRSIIACQKAQAARRQVDQGTVLGGITGLLGGNGSFFRAGDFHLSASFVLSLNAAREAAGSQHYPQGLNGA